MAASKVLPKGSGGQLLGVLGILVTIYVAWKYRLQIGQALKSNPTQSSGATLAKSGGLPGGPSMAYPGSGAPAQNTQGFSTSQPSTGQSLAQTVANLFKKSSKPETIAQALQRGDTTSANQSQIAAIYNLQTTGNPFGDSFATTLASFGLTTSPNDSALFGVNTSGIDFGASPQSFDFGSWGFSPSDYYDPQTESIDAGGIDTQAPSLFDLSGTFFDPNQFAQSTAETFGGNINNYFGGDYTGNYQLGNFLDPSSDPGFNPYLGYSQAVYEPGGSLVGGVDQFDQIDYSGYVDNSVS